MAGSGWISATSRKPFVIVPVLSKATVLVRANFSIVVPVFTTIPFLLERLIPATSAIGAAKINGQGEATTNTSAKRNGSLLNQHDIPPIK